MVKLSVCKPDCGGTGSRSRCRQYSGGTPIIGPRVKCREEGELQNNPACDLQYCDARIERKRKIDTREMLSEVYPRRIDTPSPEVGVLLLAALPQGTLVKHVDRRAKLPYSVPGRSRALDKEAREALAEYHRSKAPSYPIRAVHEQAETFGRTAHARASPTDQPTDREEIVRFR